MENKQKTTMNSTIGGALALSLSACVAGTGDSRINLGYNALETSVVTERNPEGNRSVRNRLLSNVSLGLGDLEASYHGLNEVNDWNSDSYFGRNRVMLGRKDFPLKLLIDTKADENSIFDTKYGVRYTGLMEKLGGYGQIDIGANDEAINLNIFYGLPLGKGFSIELLQDTTIQFNGNARPFNYTELQLNNSITERLSLFVRAEIPNFDEDLATYLLGVSISF